MKRRNAEIGKMRRPMKRNKITEGFYGSTLLYLKFLILWVLVILADFILEFRFEFLWPFYLLLRSVYDSYKYQGLAFSIFFVCVALTSDMLCFFFVPVHWLFFAASTYVWVQYVWHTDRGVCAPTILLWVLFVYLEAAVRLRDVKHMPGHLDLCRPFAAHCIGYPVVTLGFGFKSYIGFRMRKRKQRDVAKENEFYMQLMQQALPVDTTQQQQQLEGAGGATNAAGAGAAPASSTADSTTAAAATAVPSASNAILPAPIVQNNKLNASKQSQDRNGHIPNGTIANGLAHSHGSKTHSRRSGDKFSSSGSSEHDSRQQQQQSPSGGGGDRHADRTRGHAHSNGQAVGAGAEETTQCEPEPRPSRRKEKREQEKEREAAEYLQKLEADAKRLRIELQGSRSSEQDLRLQVASLTTAEKVSKGDLSALQREVEELQQSLQNAMTNRTADKQTLTNLERRIAEERRLRCHLESQLSQERKSRKQEEARAAQVAAQQSSRGECTDQCKARRRDLEKELAECRASKNWLDDRCAAIDRENTALAEQIRDTEILMSALSAMQEKNTHLENSLSAETRIKLDLFSALGEAKRQLEIRENAIRSQEKEIEELKSKIAQVLAVMPTDTFNGPAPSSAISRVRLGESPPGSTLDPNATAYTPKGSLVASTEA